MSKATQPAPLTFEMKAGKNGRAELKIYNVVGETWSGDGVTAKRFVDEFNKLAPKALDLRINSVGGSVMDGNAIYNILAQSGIPIDVYIDGMACSIASIIAMVGTVHMPSNTLMMIHNPSNVSFGDAKSMRKMADTLDKIKEGAVLTYSKKTGLTEEKVSKLMDDETWMTASEAYALGFCDVITDAVEAVACADLTAFGYRNIPNLSNLVMQAEPPVTPTPVPVEETSVEETTEMSTQNPATPAMPQMSAAEMEAMMKKAADEAVAKQAAETAKQLAKMQADTIRKDFAMLVSAGKLTPGQSKMFGTLAEALASVGGEYEFSLKADGSEAQKGSALDVLKAVAGTMSGHGLLQEQVATNDATGTTAAAPVAQAAAAQATLLASFKPSKNDVPEMSSRVPESWFQDQYIQKVLMAADPSLKYADAAKLTETTGKDQYQKALKSFLNG